MLREKFIWLDLLNNLVGGEDDKWRLVYKFSIIVYDFNF